MPVLSQLSPLPLVFSLSPRLWESIGYIQDCSSLLCATPVLSATLNPVSLTMKTNPSFSEVIKLEDLIL